MREKAAVCTGIWFILTAMLILALVPVNASAWHSDERGAPAIVLSHDKTALPDFVYNLNSASEPYVLGEIHISAGSCSPENIPHLSRNSSAIVRGKLSDIYYTFIDGLAWTQANICISESLKGTLAVGDIISVYFPGGYASATDYEACYGEGSAAENSRGFYRFVAEGISPPEPGDEALFFLSEAAPGSGLPEGAYELSCERYAYLSFCENGSALCLGSDRFSYTELKLLIVLSLSA